MVAHNLFIKSINIYLSFSFLILYNCNKSNMNIIIFLIITYLTFVKKEYKASYNL